MPDRRALIVDDDRLTAEALRNNLQLDGHRADIATSAAQALKALAARNYDVVITDLRMPEVSGIELCDEVRNLYPDTQVVILTAYGTIENAVEAVKRGAYDYLTKPVDPEKLSTLIDRIVEVHRLRDENRTLRDQIRAQRQSSRLIGSSPKMVEVLETIRTVAPTDATVLVRGESGTGKELVATAIHQLSPRSEQPLVKVNCAAIPETLLEDELFGHERGAFTGAHAQRKGRFETAHRGTIFLDEIAEMSPAVQAKLLRVTQEREFERVGGSDTIPVDVRIICSTNQNLEEAVREGRFREDLYYRVNVVPIVLPPLRERRDDILLLANHFLERFAERNNKSFQGISQQAQQKLLRYHWPGNVRELENCIERAVVMARGDAIEPGDIALNPDISGLAEDDIASQLVAEGFSVEDFERKLIHASLQKTGGNQSRAAELLGLTRRTLQYRIEKYDIQVPKD
ncbi:MAG: sigma-54-dependent transcriptional regulator [Candidatus Brocadiia bacterium]